MQPIRAITGSEVARQLAMQVKMLVVAVLVGSSLSTHAAEEQRVTVRAYPAVSFAPASLSIRTTVATHEQNRAVEISVESLTFYRSSEIALFGERGPRTTMLRLASVPGGYYEIRAIVKGAKGQELATAQTVVRVIDHNEVP